jgi:hypothetical protein
MARPSSSSIGHRGRCNEPVSRAQQDAKASIARYWEQTPPSTRVEINIAKEEARVERSCIRDDDIEEDVGQWIPETGNTSSGNTKYLQTMDLYW